ncbi:MAG: hypothetical protein ACKO37_03080 [Vampirovibrionales bacterium]
MVSCSMGSVVPRQGVSLPAQRHTRFGEAQDTVSSLQARHPLPDPATYATPA